MPSAAQTATSALHLTGCCAALLALILCCGAAAHAGPPHGLFVYETGASNFPAELAQDTSLKGVSFTSDWSDVEPQQHVYDWTQLDKNVAAAAAAGLQVALRVTPGVFSPNWVYAIGAKKLYFRWYLSGNQISLCSLVSMPVPWDPIYLSAWTTFVRAFAAHYADNPAVSMIHLEGITSATNETLLIYTAGTHSVGGGVCGAAPVLPVTAWQAAGYTPDKVTGAWSTILAAYVAGFPNQQLTQEVGNWGFPPIDNTGAIVGGSSGDMTEGPALMQVAADTVGAHFGLQNDGLSVHWVFPLPSTVPATTPRAFDVMPMTGVTDCQDNNFDTPCNPATMLSAILANATAVHAPYVEFAPIDIENPALAEQFAAYSD